MPYQKCGQYICREPKLVTYRYRKQIQAQKKLKLIQPTIIVIPHLRDWALQTKVAQIRSPKLS